MSRAISTISSAGICRTNWLVLASRTVIIERSMLSSSPEETGLGPALSQSFADRRPLAYVLRLIFRHLGGRFNFDHRQTDRLVGAFWGGNFCRLCRYLLALGPYRTVYFHTYFSLETRRPGQAPVSQTYRKPLITGAKPKHSAESNWPGPTWQSLTAAESAPWLTAPFLAQNPRP